MITVTRRLISEEDAAAKLSLLSRRYDIPNGCYDESAADRMSDFDAQKWLSLCDLRRAAQRRRHNSPAACDIPDSLRSIYGMKAPFHSEELENTSDTLIALAA
jgi:hypothetical protein